MKYMQRQHRASKQPQSKTKERKPNQQPADTIMPLSLSSVIGNKAMQRLLNGETKLPQGIGLAIQRQNLPTNAEYGYSPAIDNSSGLYEPLDSSYVQSLDYAGLKALAEMLKAEMDIHQVCNEETQPLYDNFDVVNAIMESKINYIFDSFPEGMQKDGTFPKETRDRMEFMEYMAQYLGTYQNVIDHFMQIRKANIPGMVYLHDRAASRVEGVAGDLGGKMPASYVGLGLRGRYRVHERNSNSRMAHPLGYAMDYRAYDNPMITDKATVAMLNIDTGGPINLQLEMSRTQRRQLLAQMGRGEADEQKMTDFFEKFEEEYERASKASASFGDSLGEDAITTLKALRPRYLDNKKQRADNERQSKKITKQLKPIEARLERQKKPSESLTAKRDALVAQQTELDTQMDTLDEEYATIQEELQEVVNPWYEKITAAKEKIEADNPDVFGEQDPSQRLSWSEKRRRQELKDKRASYDVLEQRLKTDIEFVLGGKEEKVVRNPSLLQLMERGFFTPDAEPEEGEDFNPRKHGFNLEFMKMMAKHGFDQGIAWSETSLDAMHFELVEGVDSLPGRKQVEAGLESVRSQFPRKRR